MSATVELRPLTRPSVAAERVREAIRERAARGETVRIVGRGTWLDAGRPVAPEARPLPVAEHAGIVEYNPGDLTLTALAGTTLEDIRRATRRERQWLALDPFGGDHGTLGATVATGSYGPLAHAFGTPRDNVLGVEFVTGAGDVVRGGGRVVKNVAGFDLARLVTGAWGTLGVITEVTVRLRALPEMDEAVALAAPTDPALLAGFLRRLREAPIAPLALELVNGVIARAAGLGDRPAVFARLGGNEPLVRAQRQALAALGDVVAAPSHAADWLRLGEQAWDDPRYLVARVSRRPSRLAETWAEATALLERLGGGSAQASVGRGVVRIDAAAVDHDLVRAAFGALPRGERAPAVVFERLPAPLWPELAPSAAADRLARGVRAAFDPHRLLNPGILGE